ncbi:Sec-independent protein translocase family protein [Candidatus Rickettsiella viridis]|uniref:twin-arginine translocase TatA/TatE family subunit n=1 Tax=Candidatus Rickettsiella viridis TaxID=676208 RepID=UPI000F82D43D|nr:twin-arginine translocase TatA/TatE family subunit [Candidatus Rickettsiella viridis]
MRLHGISIISLLIIFLIAVLLFGTKRLGSMLEDLVVAIKNCSKNLGDEQEISLEKKSKSEKFDSD